MCLKDGTMINLSGINQDSGRSVVTWQPANVAKGHYLGAEARFLLKVDINHVRSSKHIVAESCRAESNRLRRYNQVSCKLETGVTSS